MDIIFTILQSDYFVFVCYPLRHRLLNIPCTDIFSLLTLSSLQTTTDTFGNSADPDEKALDEPSHQDLHCLLFCY